MAPVTCAGDEVPLSMSQTVLDAPLQDQRLRGHALHTVVVPVAASLVVALAARISFPLPFTPVPFTLQPLAVLGVGLALGPWRGAWAMVLYLLEGALGAPVFSATGPGGLLQLFGPTGGFLLAYPAVAFVCGGLVGRLEAKVSRFGAAVAAGVTATALLFLLGALWLRFEAHLTAWQALSAAVLPFLPGEAVKVLAAAGVYRALKTPSSTLRAH